MSDDFRYKVVEAASLTRGPVRRETLPDWFLVRARLVYHVVGDVCGMSFAELEENFRRDADPAAELQIWERIALVVADMSQTGAISAIEKGSVFATLLFASTGVPASAMFEKAGDISPDLRERVTAAARELGFG